MKTTTAELIADLTSRTQDNLAAARRLTQLSPERLTARPAPGAWNALECLEHLCRYGDFYLPEIATRLKNAKSMAGGNFRSGILGNKLALAVHPNARAIKTFKKMNPLAQVLRTDVLNEFITQQETLLQLLATSGKVDVNRIKTAVSITKLVRLRLGDTLRVVVYHNQRHTAQAQRAAGIMA